MREVPRIRQLKSQLELADSHMMRLKRVIDSAPDPASKLKQFARELNYVGLADTLSDGSGPAVAPSGDDVVLSVAVSSPKAPNERVQEIEFLGSQNLLEIGRHIACLR